jgi:uncharacterized protein (TIGR02246 family)
MSADRTTVEQRLRVVEDLLAIQRLVNDYGHLLDAGDFEGFAELFAGDGQLLLGPVARATGREAIRAAMQAALPGPYGHSFHVVGTPRVELDGDRATSETMWTVIDRGPDGAPVVNATGRHRDDLVREDGRWKFQRRRGFVDIPSALPSSATSGADRSVD